MTEASNTNRSKTDAGKSRWASKIAARYRCDLSDELVEWFDQEVWQTSGRGEYRQPITPDELLSDAPDSIWPALMPCDLLPISGNTAGDWLCLRIDDQNKVSEVVQWYHGGGDWIPWGRTLAEAVVFDALSTRLPGPQRGHSIPAEEPRLDSPPGDARPSTDQLIAWAAPRVPPEVAALLDRPTNSSTDSSTGDPSIAETLLRNEIAEVAVRCSSVQNALHQKMTDTLSAKLANEWNVPWDDMVAWTFDGSLVPADRRSQLEDHLGHEIGDEQDWALARQHCAAVTNLSTQLAWPWEIMGYAAERNGDTESAMNAYRRASRCSIFTDQSVRLRTHWATASAAKFSVARMLKLNPTHVAQDDYLQRLCLDDLPQRRLEACQYWRDQATRSRDQGCHAEAHRYEMAAGWDLGAEPMATFGELLEAIADAADRSDQVARAEIARTHRACLASRYGI